ncbi:hypothetical protein HKX48_006665 [Thoreauomyces humboldtii]|nr:hypothetical protein HKX48_006665 [Thoreauomyces humboldtii]
MARKKHGRNKTLERPSTAAQDEIDFSKNASANLENLGLDAEDEFHDQRETILLEDPAPRRSGRRGQNDDSDGEVEVFGLDVEDSDEEEEEEAEDMMDEDEFTEDEDDLLLKKLQMGIKRGQGVDSDDDDDDDEEGIAKGKKGSKKGGKGDVGSDDDQQAWGKSRGIYYNADDASDDEDAKAEEEEALRLQRLRTSQMREEDFLDDLDDSFGKRIASGDPSGRAGLGPDGEDEGLDHLAISTSFPLHLLPTQTEMEVVSRDTSGLPVEELLKVAEASIPEVVLLLEHFRNRWDECRNILGPALMWTARTEASAGGASHGATMGREYAELKYRLITAYLTNIAFYLSMRANPPPFVNLKSHPVVDSIDQLRELLEHLETTVEGRDDSSDEEMSEADSDEDAAARKRRRKRRRKERKIRSLGNPRLQAAVQDFLENGDFSDEEEEQDAEELVEEEKEEEVVVPAPTKRKKSAGSTAANASTAKPIVKRHLDVHIPEAEFVPVGKPKKTKSKIARAAMADQDFGDDATIDDADLDDKMARKKSLKFHVTRVDQAITTRQNRLQRSGGGDDDLPYRDRDGKLILPDQPEAAPKPVRKLDLPDDLADNSDNHTEDEEDSLDEDALIGMLDGPSSTKGRKRARGVEDGDEEESPEAYYERVAGAKKAKKSERKERGDIENAANALANRYSPKRSDLFPVASPEIFIPFIVSSSLPHPDYDIIDAHAKRPASYRILANKGLTPHRSKEQRNPRVKKRMRFEAAQKKLGSFKRLVKDPKDARQYGGEKTGIKANLARSVKFAN